MQTSVKTKKKLTGAHYTPPELAAFLATELCKYVPETGEMEVMDPACGDGELLLSLREAAKLRGLKLSFTAVDRDTEALATLSARWPNTYPIWYMQEDFLSMKYGEPSAELFQNGTGELGALERVDLIIANPPYVRTQHLGSERAQQLAMDFALTGRVDLYHAFLIAMTNALREGGLLGVITSNRFLSTRGGEAVRAFLAKSYELLEVIDLGDTKLFEAAVLPAIIIARKRTVGTLSSPRFLKIYECEEAGEQVASVYEALVREPGTYTVGRQNYRVSRGRIRLSEPSDPWQLTDEEEERLLARINRNGTLPLGEIANVKVGVKTTADSVFIRKDWDGIEFAHRPESELLRPIIDSSDCKRWNEPTPRHSILYPYEVEGGRRRPIDLSHWPRAEAYFGKYEQRLKGRTYIAESNREWFEIWVPHHPESWSQEMIVGPDISPEPRFALSTNSAVVNGNCYWITLKQGVDKDFMYVILALLNSKLFVRYYDLAFNNKLYSGRRRYLTQYLEKYPIYIGSKVEYAEIVSLSKRLCVAVEAQIISSLEEQLEALVLKYYGLC